MAVIVAVPLKWAGRPAIVTDWPTYSRWKPTVRAVTEVPSSQHSWSTGYWNRDSMDRTRLVAAVDTFVSCASGYRSPTPRTVLSSARST